MLIAVGLAAGAVLAVSLPYWLSPAIVRLRMRIFTRVNGEEGIPIPGPLVDASRFKQVYSHPAADGRSRGAALSDLFWYWLSPGAEMHQEHLEPGKRYEEVARSTRRILALSKAEAEDLASRCVTRVLDQENIRSAKLVRLRDLMMPIWAEFYYELVFGEICPRNARDLIVGNANDVVTALKCCGLRHMQKRNRLTHFLIHKLDAGVAHTLPESLSTEERALYLQGVFFNTAVVQMSEAMAHLLMVIAQQDVQAALAADTGEAYLDHVIAETFRMFPLFGIAHRITSSDIAVDEQATIPKGSVVCFNYPEYHRAGFDEPDRFDPARWENLAVNEATYVPFGVTGNRPCPAHAVAPITMRVAAREMLNRFSLHSSASHTRSIPNKGPCLLMPKGQRHDPRRRRAWLVFMHIRDRWEDVWRSIVQLGCGTFMVWHARQLQLCRRYFERSGDDDRDRPVGAVPGRPAGCPMSHLEHRL